MKDVGFLKAKGHHFAKQSIDNWVTVPPNSIVTIHNQRVLIHPIIDEFYNHDPVVDRSSSFAVSKGLVSKSPGTTVPPPPMNEPEIVPASDVPSPRVELGKRLSIDATKLNELDRRISQVRLQA